MFVLANIFAIALILDFTSASAEPLAFGFQPSLLSNARKLHRQLRHCEWTLRRFRSQQHSYCFELHHRTFKFRRNVAIFSTSSAKSSPSWKQPRALRNGHIRVGGSSKVIFEKIVRPPSGMVDTLLLGYLVEYLQEQFTLPDRLPMTYSISTPTNSASREPILQWNSPLSPNPKLTAISVHIVGIFGDASNDRRHVVDGSIRETAPNMAMVVLEKESSGTEPSIPPMLANLFFDSERQIIRALDRGLDEFMLGLTRSKQKDSNNPLSELSYKNQFSLEGNAIAAAKTLHDIVDINVDALSKDKDRGITPLLWKQNGFIDANVTQRNGISVGSDDDFSADHECIPNKNVAVPALREKQREAALQSMIFNDSSQDPPSRNSIAPSVMAEQGFVDFAVQAARIAHAKRQLQRSTIVNSTDFAVEAALLVAARRRLDLLQRKETVESEIKSLRSPMLDLQNVSTSTSSRHRTFMSTISTPESFLKEKNEASSMSQEQRIKDKANTVVGESVVNASRPLDSQTVPQVSSKFLSEKTLQTNRSINLKIEENGTATDVGMPISENGVSFTKEKEIMQVTLDALNEVAESGKDLTPEELLDEVMRYGDDQDRRQEVGAGFVSGAFEKAKALLREQAKRREERMQLHPPLYKASSSNDLNSVFVAELGNAASETMPPSEELRRMFEAGERLAAGRITSVIKDNDSKTLRGRSTTHHEIDELIESDKTVSRHARVLDEELTELMVRINKSPGEETDGPNKNPLFDIFSGPEVYAQNVDPLSAVNWPGALPGSKSIRLPKDLDEALRQAKFAAHILMHLKEVESKDGSQSFSVGSRDLNWQQVSNLRVVVEEAVEIGLIVDPYLLQEEKSRLEILLNEMIHQPEERMREIASNYKDLLLSDNFVGLVRKRLNEMTDRELDALRRGNDDALELTHAREREVLGHLVVFAQLLLKEVQALGAELESQQLEVIRSICKVAMDPSHRTEEEAAMALTDAVRDMRPLFDDGFVAYLKYAVAEEEGRLARAGLLNDADHTHWLYVLKIVQQGVHAEIAKGINRYLEHIWYVLRMETPVERRLLLEKFVDVMPTLDVRPFVQVVDNIVGSLGDSARGEFDGATTLGEMTNKLLQLRRDLKEILPPDRLTKKSRDADEWVAKQKHRLLEQRNLTKQRLKAAHDIEHLDSTIESFGTSGEVERFE
jgi:hypothetical protein